MADELKAGVAEVNVTPPIGMSLCGFGNRAGPAETVYDDLFARALVLDDGRTRLAIVTSDLISFAPDLVQRIRILVGRGARVPRFCPVVERIALSFRPHGDVVSQHGPA